MFEQVSPYLIAIGPAFELQSDRFGRGMWPVQDLHKFLFDIGDVFCHGRRARGTSPPPDKLEDF